MYLGRRQSRRKSILRNYDNGTDVKVPITVHKCVETGLPRKRIRKFQRHSKPGLVLSLALPFDAGHLRNQLGGVASIQIQSEPPIDWFSEYSPAGGAKEQIPGLGDRMLCRKLLRAVVSTRKFSALGTRIQVKSSGWSSRLCVRRDDCHNSLEQIYKSIEGQVGLLSTMFRCKVSRHSDTSAEINMKSCNFYFRATESGQEDWHVLFCSSCLICQ